MDFEAYFDEWSRLPGERVRMAISTEHAEVHASLEHIISGPSTSGVASHSFGPSVPGLDAVVRGVQQTTAIGSFAELPLGRKITGDFAVHLWFWATVAGGTAQTIWSMTGAEIDFAIAVEGNELIVTQGAQRIPLGMHVESLVWYSLLVQFRPQDTGFAADVHMVQQSRLPANAPSMTTLLMLAGVSGADRLLLACSGVDNDGSPVAGFNGKIGTPSVFTRHLNDDELRAAHLTMGDNGPPADFRWDLARGVHSDAIAEAAGRAPDGTVRNGGERAVTSHNWSGAVDSFVEAPEQYRAIQFHADDMIDSGWTYNLEFDLPPDLESGVYAVRLEADGQIDRYPLFIRGPEDTRADVLMLFPTNTYLAYANDRFASGDLSAIMGHERGAVSDDEQYLNAHPKFGLSCYDVHSDGTPVRFSSRRRPLVNVRPHYPNWLTGSYRHFAVDLFVLEWLHRSQYTYHVATDEDLHLAGAELLSRYKVVVTGSHPEYWSGAALTVLTDYLASGGKMMYLGGNGFYWVTTHDAERPWRIEVRRDNAGLRAWDAPPGERHHSQTGEPGGLWRYRGRGPNHVAGVAFAMEGFSKAQGYRRTPASYEGRPAEFFAGIDEALIGDFGYILGGAAGDECDRHDASLGSPAQSQILASATGFGPEYLMVNEDVHIPMPNQDGPNRPDRVRSDMVYLPIHGGGEVFSASSIAFAGAIAWNNYDNNIARLADNVLKAFVGQARV